MWEFAYIWHQNEKVIVHTVCACVVVWIAEALKQIWQYYFSLHDRLGEGWSREYADGVVYDNAFPQQSYTIGSESNVRPHSEWAPGDTE